MTSSFEPFPPPRFEPLPEVSEDETFVPMPLGGTPELPAPEPEPEPERPDADAIAAAWQQGYDRGHAEAGDPEQLTRAVAALETAARGLDAQREGYLDAQREWLVELALALASWVLRQELATEPARLLALLEAASERLAPATPLRVQLAPEDLARLDETDLSALDVVLEADPGLASGEALVNAGAARIDLRAERLVGHLREVLAEATPALAARNEGGEA